MPILVKTITIHERGQSKLLKAGENISRERADELGLDDRVFEAVVDPESLEYADMSQKELLAKCKARDLSPETTKKSDMIAALEAADASNVE